MQPAAVSTSGVSGPAEGADAGQPASLVVVIGASATERRDLVQQLGSERPVLMVRDVEQARGLLAPGEDHAQAPEEAGDEEPAARAAVGLRLVPGRRAVQAGRGEAALTPLEYAVLECLLAAAGQVCTFSALNQHAWRTGHLGDGSHVHAVIKRLRPKLRAVGARARIEAVRGVGFRLCAPATEPRAGVRRRG